jgi:hypothetical protein
MQFGNVWHFKKSKVRPNNENDSSNLKKVLNKFLQRRDCIKQIFFPRWAAQMRKQKTNR